MFSARARQARSARVSYHTQVRRRNRWADQGRFSGLSVHDGICQCYSRFREDGREEAAEPTEIVEAPNVHR